MPTYTYEALNAAGKPQKGTIEAKTADEAVQRIKSQGFFPTSVREQKIKGGGGGGAPPAAPPARRPRRRRRASPSHSAESR
ncbi:MAG: hypothetical protein ACO38V_10115 [Phycisphaerales bacterium]